MIPAEFLEFIENNFQEEEKQVLIPCLLQDRRVQEALSKLEQNEEKDTDRLKNLENWKPVYFAFLLQDKKNWKQDLSTIVKNLNLKTDGDISSINAVLNEKNIDLEKAADAAIELLKIINKKGWKEIEEEILDNFQFTTDAGLIAACLLGLVDLADFIDNEIAQSTNCEVVKMFCYGLFCNPIQEAILEKYAAKLLDDLEKEEKIEILQFIGAEGRIQLSKVLIQNELQNTEENISLDSQESLQKELKTLQDLNFLSDIHLLEGKRIESQNEIEQFIQKLDQLKSEAQQKKSSLIPSNGDKVGAPTQEEPFQYNWKNVPQKERSFYWKKPTDQNIEEFLKAVEKEITFHSSDSSFFIQLAELFHSVGSFRKSIESLKIAKMLDKENPRIEAGLINAFIENDQWDAALRQIKTKNVKDRGLDLNPFYVESKQILKNGDSEAVKQRLQGLPQGFTSMDSEVLFEVGDLYLDVGELEQAKSYFEQSIIAGTTKYQAWINSYICLFKLNQKEKAERLLSEAIETFHERKGFYEHVILALIDCGEEDRGQALIEKINVENGDPDALAAIISYLGQEKLYDHAYDLALKSISHYPLHANLGMQTAQAFLENEEYEKADRRLNLVSEGNDQRKEFILLQSLSALKSKISTFPLGSQKADESTLAAILEKVKELPQGDYWQGLIEAEIHSLQDLYNKAIEKFKELILENSLSKNRTELWRAQVGLAQALMNTNQTETAITLLNEALRVQHDSLMLYELLADAYRNKNLSEEAENTIKRAQQLCSTDKKFTSWYVAQMLKLGKPEEVRSYFSKEATLHQASPEFLVERMNFENQYGSTGETKATIQDLILLEKVSAKDLHTALEITQAARFHDLSLKIIEKLQKTDQDDLESCVLRACVYWNQGNHQFAISSLDPVTEIQPWEAIQDALRILDDPLNNEQMDILSIIENNGLIEKQIRDLPDYITNILPNEWLTVFTSNDLWIKLFLLKTFEDNSKDNVDFMESTFDLQADQVSTNVFLAVCKWMKNGEENTADWIRLLNELNKIDDLEKRTALTGIILNILLENGNEIAVATTINTLSDEFLQERTILFAKARLLGRNRNSEDARQTYQKALNMPMRLKQSEDPDESILTTLVNLPKWQADCAIEQGDWVNAVAASIQCLQFPAYYSYVKENTINRIYNLALKEWSYQKIEVSKNLPAVLKRDEFTNLPQQISPFSAELQNQYTFLHDFLLNGQIQPIESASEEPLSVVCQMISASNHEQYEKMLQILEKDKKANDLPLIALGLFPENKFNELIPAFQDAFHENKKDPYLSAGMAKIFAAENETDLAIDAYENALNILTDEPFWRTSLAKLYEEKGELQKAILHSEQAVTLDPGNQNNKKEYLEDLYAVQDYRKVIEFFEENQQQFSSNDAVLRKVINAYFQVGDYRKALSYIQMQHEKMKGDLEMLLIQARIAEKLGNIPKAMEIIRNAYQIDPKSPEVIIELARIKSLEEHDEFGLEIIEKALESNITSEQLILEKAAYLERVYGKKRAIDFLGGYLEKVPEPDFQLLNQHANLLHQAGKNEEALSVCERSIQLNDAQADIHKMIGIISMEKGNLDKAVFHFDKAIHFDPHDMQVYLDLAEVLLSRRESQRAEKVIQMALENCKEHYLIFEKASKVYNQLGDAEKAESYLRKATALNPTNEDLREKLGILLAKRIFNK